MTPFHQVQSTNILTRMSVLGETNLVPVDHRLGFPTRLAVEGDRLIPEKFYIDFDNIDFDFMPVC